MVWQPDGEKNFDDTFIRFNRIHESDRHTGRQTPHDDIGRACIALRGKKNSSKSIKMKIVTTTKGSNLQRQ